MIKALFNSCIAHWKRSVSINLTDCNILAEALPFNANAHFAILSRIHPSLSSYIIDNKTIFLPDRSALYYRVLDEGISSVSADNESPPVAQTHATMMHPVKDVAPVTIGPKVIQLPVYQIEKEDVLTLANPETVPFDELEEWEWKLLSRLGEDEEIQTEIQLPFAAADISHGPTEPAVPKIPVLERFDPSLGIVSHEKAGIGASFIDWMRNLSKAHTHTPAEVSESGQEGNLDEKHGKHKKDKKKGHKKEKGKRKKLKMAKILAKTSIKEKEDIVSETLAALLANQGHKDAAIAMYQKLILHNPEKKSIFAAQISKLKTK